MVRAKRRAWVAWNPLDSTYSGYVASLDEHGAEVGKVSDAPEGLGFEEVVRWATEEAAQVFVRPHWDSGTTYWAGDGNQTAHPVLDPSRAQEPADRVEGAVATSAVAASCAHCDWHGTFADRAELVAAYADHAQSHQAGPALS